MMVGCATNLLAAHRGATRRWCCGHARGSHAQILPRSITRYEAGTPGVAGPPRPDGTQGVDPLLRCLRGMVLPRRGISVSVGGGQTGDAGPTEDAGLLPCSCAGTYVPSMRDGLCGAVGTGAGGGAGTAAYGAAGLGENGALHASICSPFVVGPPVPLPCRPFTSMAATTTRAAARAATTTITAVVLDDSSSAVVGDAVEPDFAAAPQSHPAPSPPCAANSSWVYDFPSGPTRFSPGVESRVGLIVSISSKGAPVTGALVVGEPVMGAPAVGAAVFTAGGAVGRCVSPCARGDRVTGASVGGAVGLCVSPASSGDFVTGAAVGRAVVGRAVGAGVGTSVAGSSVGAPVGTADTGARVGVGVGAADVGAEVVGAVVDGAARTLR